MGSKSTIFQIEFLRSLIVCPFYLINKENFNKFSYTATVFSFIIEKAGSKCLWNSELTALKFASINLPISLPI